MEPDDGAATFSVTTRIGETGASRLYLLVGFVYKFFSKLKKKRDFGPFFAHSLSLTDYIFLTVDPNTSDVDI